MVHTIITPYEILIAKEHLSDNDRFERIGPTGYRHRLPENSTQTALLIVSDTLSVGGQHIGNRIYYKNDPTEQRYEAYAMDPQNDNILLETIGRFFNHSRIATVITYSARKSYYEPNDEAAPNETEVQPRNLNSRNRANPDQYDFDFGNPPE